MMKILDSSIQYFQVVIDLSTLAELFARHQKDHQMLLDRSIALTIKKREQIKFHVVRLQMTAFKEN